MGPSSTSSGKKTNTFVPLRACTQKREYLSDGNDIRLWRMSCAIRFTPDSCKLQGILVECREGSPPILRREVRRRLSEKPVCGDDVVLQRVPQRLRFDGAPAGVAYEEHQCLLLPDMYSSSHEI